MTITDAQSNTPRFKGKALPEGSGPVNILDVDYLHVKTADGGDLYLTKYGLPFIDNLHPDNWHEKSWFEQNREKLVGTSTVYKVPTRTVNGRNVNLVVKWCRVGEDVPMDTLTLNKFIEAEFNSPYEEFSLLLEMRDHSYPRVIRTHRPLGIYVPAQRMKLWQTGRSTTKIAQKKAKHRDVELDIYRQYILIYEWIEGVSAVEAYHRLIPDREARRQELEKLTYRVIDELAGKGYRVLDMKPEHIIVRFRPDGTLLKRHDGRLRYALVDFELLDRTPEYEKEVKARRRASYLTRQRDRFHAPREKKFPEHLRPATIMGVDYVYGHTESTQGSLWVVGNDPGLFDYFQPERWRRTKRQKISQTNEVYYTKTKDNIHLVWKVSKVGEMPDFDTNDERGRRIVEFGYNSPFEEFALAAEFIRRGIPGVYPRAVYMTGQESGADDYIADGRRYESHIQILGPEGEPVLRADHLYITIWGYWNGLDELLATRDGEYVKGINLLEASAKGAVGEEVFKDLLRRQGGRLEAAGFEDLNLKADHLLLSLMPSGDYVRDAEALPEVRHCNFELMKRRK